MPPVSCPAALTACDGADANCASASWREDDELRRLSNSPEVLEAVSEDFGGDERMLAAAAGGCAASLLLPPPSWRKEPPASWVACAVRDGGRGGEGGDPTTAHENRVTWPFKSGPLNLGHVRVSPSTAGTPLVHKAPLEPAKERARAPMRPKTRGNRQKWTKTRGNTKKRPSLEL